jgi:hypothetical protein
LPSYFFTTTITIIIMQAEALLRSLFRTLDPEDTGTTPVILLADCLGITLDTSPRKDNECQFPPQFPLEGGRGEDWDNEGDHSGNEDDGDDHDDCGDDDYSQGQEDEYQGKDEDGDDVSDENGEISDGDDTNTDCSTHCDWHHGANVAGGSNSSCPARQRKRTHKQSDDEDINSLRSLVKAALGRQAWRRLKEGLRDTWLQSINKDDGILAVPTADDIVGGSTAEKGITGPTITWGEVSCLFIECFLWIPI